MAKPALFSLLLLLCACSGNHPVAPAATVPLPVLAVAPRDGAEAVEPRAEVTATFGLPAYGITFDDFTVDDGAGPLPGQIDVSVDGRTWRWRPFRDLPRGGRMRVRLAAGILGQGGARLLADFTSAFTVREGAVTEHALGNAAGAAPRAWCSPNGGLQVAGGTALHEITAGSTGSLSLPATGELEGLGGDAAGGCVVLFRRGLSPFVLEAVQCPRGGPARPALVAAPAGAYLRSEFAVGARGGAVAYWHGLQAGQVREGLHVLRPGTTSWLEVPLVAAGAQPLRHLAIDGDGNVFAGHVDGLLGRLAVQRWDVATGASEVHDVAELPDDFAIGAAVDGSALVAYAATGSTGGATERVRWCRRYVPGTGFGPAVVTHRGADWADQLRAFAADGSAVFVLREPSALGWQAQRLLVQRFEADGSAGTPELVRDGPVLALQALAISPRGAAWYLFVAADAQGRDAITGAPSRPGTGLGAPRTLYTSPLPSLRIRALGAALDEGGRMVVAFHVDRAIVGLGPELRALALE